MRQPLDLKFLESQPWLIEPSRFQGLLSFAQCVEIPSAQEVRRVRGERLEEAKQAATKAIRSVKGKIGVIAMYGPVEQRLSWFGVLLGGCSTEEMGMALDMLVNDKQVEAVVLHCDSPGGTVYGIEELSDKIYAARGSKPIYAIADSMSCSASYWLATSAEQMFSTPGGDVGSVGVYAAHIDESRALESEGVKVTFVSAGRFKTEGNRFEPLGMETKNHWQSQVDAVYDKFLRALKRNRGVSLETVRERFGQGRVLGAEQALEAGMLDRILSFESLIGKLTGGGNPGAVRQASVEILRLRHERQRQGV